MKILIGQLASFGDCLYATVIAKQIKIDYPNCHLTWAIGAKYQSVIYNNPYIDKIWIIDNNDYYFEGWTLFENECNKLKSEGVFDKIFLSQIYPKNLYLFDGTIRSSILQVYPNKITDVTPIIQLTKEEINNVNSFILKYKLINRKLIIFEFAPSSMQSYVNLEFALKTAELLLKILQNNNLTIILSSHLKITTGNESIIDGSELTFRENAELLNRSELLIGCSSGITWLSTSNWVKKIPTIQLINHKSYWFAGMIYDFQYHGLNHDNIIELRKCSPEYLTNCINYVLSFDVYKAKNIYNYIVKPKIFTSFRTLQYNLLCELKFKKVQFLLKNHIKRHGFKFIFLIYTIINILFMPLAPFIFLKNYFLKIKQK